MVKVRDDLPINQDGSINLNDWLNRIKQAQHLVDSDQALLLKAGQLSLEYGAHCLTPFGETCFQAGLMTAEILVMLNADQEAIAAALLYFCVIDGKLTEEQVAKQLNSQVSTLIVGVKKVSVVANTNSTLVPPPKTKGFNHQQRDNLRRMLLAIIEDVRVVLIKLAERITALRNCIKLPTTLCQAQALEARDIYAPLANRLGIGQIKWEIEDLAFRYLEPKAYKKIAYLLDEKRISREKYINTLIETIKAQLITNDVVAQVFGRVKHIYSIWRKMLRKAVTFEEIYDVRAIRILVPKLRDCYAALGVVHSLWQHIPKEFDDYIATPKENGYRSLHTAVIGPEGKFLEIQIRTYQMDKEAELGVAAHWMYKEKGRLDTKYQEKLNHLRKTLVDSDKIEDDFESAALLKEEILEERVYVFTPKGQVIDLPSSATPLDFAYHIHTELGHRCRGAKINNQLVPLTYQLKSGDQVEIISSKQGSPSRDWLNPGLGYIKSSRAQAKVVSWYRRQAREQHIIQGREILDKESKKFGLHKLNISKVSAQLNYTKSEDLLVALGSGNVKFSKVLETQDLEEKKNLQI